jgi:poly(ADP-ribose) glycohydrolase
MKLKVLLILQINIFISIELFHQQHKKKFYVRKFISIFFCSSFFFKFLVSCCPEAFLSILVCETLEDDEIVILRGCKRFVDYSGYADTFAYKNPYHEQNPNHIQDILVMDACYSGQFTRKNIDRDLGKAWAAFDKSRDEIIVTGNWGCGVFGGDLIFKFLQQLCAAMILGDHFKRLDYSAYHDERLASILKDLLDKLEKKKKTVADIYQMMIKYGETYASRPTFSNYVEKWLDE